MRWDDDGQLVTLLKAKAHRHAGGKRVSQADSGELRRLIASRAYDRCEYCKTPNAAALWPHEPDHIIAEQHGGATSPENLALACFQGNRLKGPNIASVDPQTGAVTRLYHPRSDTWSDRFRLEASRIVPLTAPGRATASLLRLNSPERLVCAERAPGSENISDLRRDDDASGSSIWARGRASGKCGGGGAARGGSAGGDWARRLTCGTDLKVYRRGYHARMIVPPAVFGHDLPGGLPRWRRT